MGALRAWLDRYVPKPRSNPLWRDGYPAEPPRPDAERILEVTGHKEGRNFTGRSDMWEPI